MNVRPHITAGKQTSKPLVICIQQGSQSVLSFSPSYHNKNKPGQMHLKEISVHHCEKAV